MMTKSIVMLLALILTISAFGQQQDKSILYAICGKSGDCWMSMDELKTCKKELIPTGNDLKIISFKMVINLGGSMADYSSKSSLFTSQQIDAIGKLSSGNKILIEEVNASKDGKVIKIPGMIIKLK